MVETEQLNATETESLKLMKMTKGYNWEIRIRAPSNIEEQMERLKKIDDMMWQQYGGTHDSG